MAHEIKYYEFDDVKADDVLKGVRVAMGASTKILSKQPVDEASKVLDQGVINCLRGLAMDAVQQANSGHPGTPMAMAPVGYALWSRVLNYDPTEPNWMNRDRFVLSMGHASTLLYGLLHLAGVREVGSEGAVHDELAVTLEDIKSFRQLGSKCPGHPEYGHTTGVETTTGPLGQGVATSVGMAIASKWYAARYNRSDFDLFNFDVYALAGDGCLQEGISGEAASLAGHLKLDNLCWIWDNNNITIEGNTALATSEDIAARFTAYNWNVVRVEDANDVEALCRSFRAFKQEKNGRPTLVVVDSHIAFGAPTKQDTHGAHGAPLGEAEVTGAKRFYGWSEEKFVVPDEVVGHFRTQMDVRGGKERREWDYMFANYTKLHPAAAKELQHIIAGTLPEGSDICQEFSVDKALATRQSSGICLNLAAEQVPWLLGGSADLDCSCLTRLKFDGAGDFLPPTTKLGSYAGRNFHFGIREHAMGAIVNGMALSKLRPFASTFFVFSDYMKHSIRMSAIMQVPSTWVFTHDSIGVGEDGPTHQPIEHLAALRSIPGLLTFRPGDANEVLEMWKYIMQLKREPAAVILSRQALPTLDRTKYPSASNIKRGAYILAGADAVPELILMASGSEVPLMLEAHESLTREGVKVRSVSVPCLELFKQQSSKYMQSVLPDACRARVSIEAGVEDTWGRFIGLDGEHVGMSTFGASAPLKSLQKEFGFTCDEVVKTARRVLLKTRRMSSKASVKTCDSLALTTADSLPTLDVISDSEESTRGASDSATDSAEDPHGRRSPRSSKLEFQPVSRRCHAVRQ
jgi:transketolase